MFNGKRKAITFSYDDGVEQDIRLIDLFNKYGMKGTFNLNSEKFGREEWIEWDGCRAKHNTVKAADVRAIYEGHEIAGHTLTHPSLPTLSEKEIIHQVEDDRIRLSQLAGYEVRGIAYPGAGINCNDYVEQILRKHTGILYGRTGDSTFGFSAQENLMRFRPTVHHHCQWKRMWELADSFLELSPQQDAVFYIWGHSYEFDFYDQWDAFEEFLQKIAGREDIFYGTNSQVLLGMTDRP